MPRPPKTVKIIIADDHDFIRQAVCSYIPQLGEGFAVVGEVGNGLSLLELLKSQPADILILDLEMPGLDGFNVLNAIREQNIQIKSIVLSAHYNEFFFKELVFLGAASYLPKSCSRNDFVHAVQAVLKHGFYIVPGVTRKVVQQLIEESKIHFLLTKHELTERETQILYHFSNGLLYKEIAEKVCLSVNTVKFYIKALYKKTAVKSHAQLIKYAIKVGLADVEPSFEEEFHSQRNHQTR